MYFHSVAAPSVVTDPDIRRVAGFHAEGTVAFAPFETPTVETKVSRVNGHLNTVIVRFGEFSIFVGPEQAVALRDALSVALR